MESFLWACNLAAVVFIWFWVIKEDDKEIEQEQKKKDEK
jgi:hypothetical protein